MVDPLNFIGLAGVPVVVALVQACKPWIKDPRAWPALSIVFALALNLGVAALLRTDLGIAALTGIVAGLAAGGLYSAGRTISPATEPD